MDFTIRTFDERLELEGELDLAAAPLLREAVSAMSGECSSIDLAGLRFIDSTGIRELLVVVRDHPTLRVVNPADHVRRVIRVIGLEDELLRDGSGSP